MKKVNTETLPNVLNIPKVNTEKKMKNIKPERTIHKYPKRAQSEAEMMRTYFPPPQPDSAGENETKKKKP